MNHFQKIAAQLEGHGLDAMLLTGEANRFYASGFHSYGTDGVALVTRKRAFSPAASSSATFGGRMGLPSSSMGRPSSFAASGV